MMPTLGRNEKDANAVSAGEIAKHMGLRFAELRILAHDVLSVEVRPGTWITPQDRSRLEGAYEQILDVEPAIADDLEHEPVDFCPVCFDPIMYCQSHGELGDPVGYQIAKEIDEHDLYC